MGIKFTYWGDLIAGDVSSIGDVSIGSVTTSGEGVVSTVLSGSGTLTGESSLSGAPTQKHALQGTVRGQGNLSGVMIGGNEIDIQGTPTSSGSLTLSHDDPVLSLESTSTTSGYINLEFFMERRSILLDEKGNMMIGLCDTQGNRVFIKTAIPQ